ncbi:sialate:O-sulfotransferase 2-like [Antennarius striatus]|uniref:sialate:O-sulfotransferase 2-like n=1 Tax=Antennarius striatus TaxID=241820 RepID=UPI0035AD8940
MAACGKRVHLFFLIVLFLTTGTIFFLHFGFPGVSHGEGVPRRTDNTTYRNIEVMAKSDNNKGKILLRTKYIGCYPDNTQNKALRGYSFVDESMTVLRCQNNCGERGYTYAGLENGTMCFCGNQVFTQTTVDGDCKTFCTGERTLCGGVNRLSVFKLKSRYNLCLERRFLSPQSKKLVALASFPGSGNTWTRHLIELTTGFYTGSIYLDKSLYRHEFKGEGEDWRKGTTICVKTHEKTKESIDEFDSSILLIRNPYKAIISEFNRKHGGHTGFASEVDWKGTGWSVYVKNGARSWHSHILKWLNYAKNIKVIYYEDLQRNLLPQLRKIVQFLGLKVSEDRLLCVEGLKDGDFKRSKKGNLEYNPYTPEMHANFREYIRIVDAALKERQQPGLPEEYMAK